MKMDKNEILYNFKRELRETIITIQDFIDCLNLTEDEREFYKRALKILKKKYKKIDNSESITELEKYLKVKKLIKDKKEGKKWATI